MNTVNIEKLEDLNYKKWKYNNKEFLLKKSTIHTDEYILVMINLKLPSESIELERFLFHIGLKNLTELEFYGLKVVLNEKPKLTRKERDFL